MEGVEEGVLVGKVAGAVHQLQCWCLPEGLLGRLCQLLLSTGVEGVGECHGDRNATVCSRSKNAPRVGTPLPGVEVGIHQECTQQLDKEQENE